MTNLSLKRTLKKYSKALRVEQTKYVKCEFFSPSIWDTGMNCLGFNKMIRLNRELMARDIHIGIMDYFSDETFEECADLFESMTYNGELND